MVARAYPERTGNGTFWRQGNVTLLMDLAIWTSRDEGIE